MKFSAKIFAIGIVFIVCAILPKHASAQGGEVSFQVFYDNLSPYGQWVDYPGNGYVWVPSAGPDFTPYSSRGHWVWSDYGWTWASDYNWGWAPFHYGRWDRDDYYGWFWVPDNEWGPAWVSWRRSPGYYGWAPLGPHVSIDVSFGNSYSVPNDHWVFVQEQYIGRRDINNYYGPRNNNVTYINNSTIINNTYVDNSRKTTYVSGPKREEVEKITGARVSPVAIKENSKPGESLTKNELNIYRPAIVKKDDVKPAKIAEKKDVQPVNERKAIPANNVQTEKPKNTQPANRINSPKTNPTQKVDRPAQAQPSNPYRKVNTPQNNSNNKTIDAQPRQKPERQVAQPQVRPAPSRGSEQQRSQPTNHVQQPPVRPSPQPMPKEPMHQQAPHTEQHVQPMPRTQPQPEQHSQPMPHPQQSQPRQEPVQRPH